jgi:diguanylate cyclase (GGDEF)-like protein
MRRVTLIFSLVLVVGLGVGWYFRKAQLAHERDVALTATAERGVERVVSLMDSIEVAADAGVEPGATLQSIIGRAPHLGVCAISATAAECGGAGPIPTEGQIESRMERRVAGARNPSATLAVREDVIEVHVEGPEVSVIAETERDDLFHEMTDDDVRVWVTDSLPEQARTGDFIVAEGVRQRAVPVTDVPGLYVVSAADDEVSLPSTEANAFLILGVLAASLLMLAGFTAFFAQRNLVERASTDQLTRLPNRSEFERRIAELIAQSERGGRGFALLLFDLNGFKAINDTYGHQAGDELLQLIAARLARGIRGGDLVARWGGDEFVVAMPGVIDAPMGLRRGEEIAALIGGRTRIDSARESVRVGAAVGVAFWPRHGERLEQLIEAADGAMYHAKRSGQSCAVAPDKVPDLVPTEWV